MENRAPEDQIESIKNMIKKQRKQAEKIDKPKTKKTKQKTTPMEPKVKRKYTVKIKDERGNKSQVVALAKRFSLIGEYDHANKLLDKI